MILGLQLLGCLTWVDDALPGSYSHTGTTDGEAEFCDGAMEGCSPGALPMHNGVIELARAPLKVASWNLKWLANGVGEGSVPRSRGQLAALRQRVHGISADVWVFQEVAGTAAARQIVDPDQFALYFPDNGSPIQTGLAWRHGIELVSLRTLHELGKGVARPGVELVLEHNGRALWVLGVHLESGCFTPQLDDSPDCQRLGQQLPVIESWMLARQQAGEAWLVLGDFNRRLDAEDVVWQRWRDIAAAPNMVDGELVKNCLANPWPGRVDHILAAPKMGVLEVKEWAHPSEWQGAWVPDHCPLSATIFE